MKTKREPRSLRHLLQHLILATMLVIIQWSCKTPPGGKPNPPALSPQPPTHPHTAQPPSPTPAPSETETLPSLTPRSSNTPSPTLVLSKVEARTLYDINADFDYREHKLEVSQKIHYANSTQHTLRELVLMVEPNRYEGAFVLHDLSRDGRPVDEYTLEEGILRLALAEPLPPGDSLTLNMAYTLHLPARAGVFGHTERQTNLGDWYPFLAPYVEEAGWLAHAPNGDDFGTLGEHLVYESADFEVTLNLGNAGEDVTVVGSVPADREGDVYHFSARAARNFTLSASPAYEVREVERDGVTIRSVFFPEDSVAGEAALTVAGESLTIYGEVFAPYPHETFTVVEAVFRDGMEFDGLVYVGSEYYRGYDSTPKNYLTLITAHETAHQWWYGLVGNDQALEPWLDEILATYSELIYLEHAHPDAAGWWFVFRVAAYNPQGWVNGTVYDFDGFRPYINAVYLRGATFLGELREVMGEEAFFDFLAAYAEKYAHEIASGEEFWGLLAAYEVEGLEELANEYFTSK